jgi:antitoxin ParD1/3/4
LFEYEETKKAKSADELKKGEKSGFVKDFNREDFLNAIHQKTFHCLMEYKINAFSG